MLEVPPSLVRQTADRRTEIYCPGCETWRDILSYKTWNMKKEFKSHLKLIFCCPSCKHKFAPVDYDKVDG